jgi:hypothetical protein
MPTVRSKLDLRGAGRTIRVTWFNDGRPDDNMLLVWFMIFLPRQVDVSSNLRILHVASVLIFEIL